MAKPSSEPHWQQLRGSSSFPAREGFNDPSKTDIEETGEGGGGGWGET